MKKSAKGVGLAIIGGAGTPAPAAHRSLDAEKSRYLGMIHDPMVTPATAQVQGDGHRVAIPGFPLARE